MQVGLDLKVWMEREVYRRHCYHSSDERELARQRKRSMGRTSWPSVVSLQVAVFVLGRFTFIASVKLFDCKSLAMWIEFSMHAVTLART